MKAYHTYLTVTDSQQVILNDVPFQPGQRVEVLVRATSDTDVSAVSELKALFEETQALPHIQTLADDEIADEVGT